MPERGSVVLDQPQPSGNLEQFRLLYVLRLVFDTAALHFSNRLLGKIPAKIRLKAPSSFEGRFLILRFQFATGIFLV